MGNVMTCDICKRPTKKIIGKLLFVPYTGERYTYSEYEAMADVGICCQDHLSRLIRFRRRKRRAKAEPVA